MPESLEEFLNKVPIKKELVNTEGSFQCQDCDDVVLEAHYDEEELVMTWYCSHNHKSQVKF